MYTIQMVKDIFHSGSFAHSYDKQIIADIVFLLQEGLLSVEKKKISDKNHYIKHIDDIKSGKISRIDIEGGGDGHLALKLLAKNYLIAGGCEKINFEQQYEGYVPDVITFDKKIIIECGNTNADKVFYYFKNKNLKEMIIIPYPADEEANIWCYIFKPGEELSEFLFFREKEMLKKAVSKI